MKNKTELEVGDCIQRFEVGKTREISHIYKVVSVTKTLAKTDNQTFRRRLSLNVEFPPKSTRKIIAGVTTKSNSSWSDPDYFLIEATTPTYLDEVLEFFDKETTEEMQRGKITNSND